jgi:pyruvate/2-oxoglutarate dehydrogenase complex dihydrolipoamide acyltransferase (E2) component
LRARLHEFGLRTDDLSAIKGSGKAGRVSAHDLEQFLETMMQHDSSKASPMRIAVADSMRRSWSRPLATVAMEVDMSALMEHRRDIPGRPSATVYAIKALAAGLAQNDHLACRLIGDRLIHPTRIDIAYAVEVADGVRTPVISDVPGMDLAALTVAYNDTFARASDPRRSTAVLNLPSIASVSNYGTFGIRWATPVPLPDHSLILGLGAVRKVPDWDPARLAWGMTRMAEICITFDHRVADGGAAGRLLKVIRELLEHPTRL